jgi:hypothetical protein
VQTGAIQMNGPQWAAANERNADMSEKKQKELTPEELEAQQGEELPDREEMSLINANIAVPVNAAVAANGLSDSATAEADALQQTPIDQSTT